MTLLLFHKSRWDGVCVGAGIWLLHGSKKSPAVFQITFFSTSVTIFCVGIVRLWLLKVLKKKKIFKWSSHILTQNAEIVHMLSVFFTCRKINAVERSGMSAGTLTAERHTLPHHSCTSCVDYTWLYTWNVVSIWPSLFLYVGSAWHWRGNQPCRASSASSLCSRSDYKSRLIRLPAVSLRKPGPSGCW